VSIRLVGGQDKATLSVADRGKGIPPELRDKVFQPQFTTKASGSGLGLAMARQAIIQAGGKIWFESAENEGTIFHVEIPSEGAASAT
jgi:signal transduction histidine kinase